MSSLLQLFFKMYFNKLLRIPFFALTIDTVIGVDYQLDFDCVKVKCAPQLVECVKESDVGSLTQVTQSYCKSVASCIHQDIVDGLSDPMSCFDGIDHSNMSPMELKIESCMKDNGCATPRTTGLQASRIPQLAIVSVKEDCMATKCAPALSVCQGDAVCKTMFECLNLQSANGASACMAGIEKLNGSQKTAIECGWNNKCFDGAYKSADAPVVVPASPTALNTVPTTPTVVPLSDAANVALPSKSSFVQVQPLSFLSLSTASESDLKAAEATAERQAKAAEAAWEQSRKNTDSLLAKVHGEIDSLNQDLDKTSSQEKTDLALLEENRKKEDAQLEATEKKLKDLANTKVTLPSSFLEGFNTDDFLAPLRRAAQQARNFAKQLKEHSFFKSGVESSFLQNDQTDKASKALSLAEQALKRLDGDIATQKKQLAEEEEKAKREEQEAEAQANAELAPASFLQLGNLMTMSSDELKAAEVTAEKQAATAKAAWEASRKKTSSLLSKVHEEIDTLNQDIEKNTLKDKSELVLLEENRKKEDSELEATEAKLKSLAGNKVDLPAPASFIQENDDFLAPLRKAAEQAKHFAEEMRHHTFFKPSSASLLQTDDQDKAGKALSLAENALKKLDQDIAAQKKELAEEEAKAKENEQAEQPISFLQTGTAFDPLSPQALADWRDRFELQLQKAREAAGIHTPLHSSLAQLSLTPSFAENEQLREDERQVERLETQYNSQMQKLKEDNAELLARAKEEMEKAKDEENRVKNQLAQASLLQVGHKYDPAKEEAHIRDLERKWVREAESIVTPPQIVQQDNELQALIEQQKVKEAESEAQLAQMKEKLNKDIEVMDRDLASNSLSTKPAISFLQTGAKGPAEAALERAEADLQKLKQQLREETAKLNSMHFD